MKLPQGSKVLIVGADQTELEGDLLADPRFIYWDAKTALSKENTPNNTYQVLIEQNVPVPTVRHIVEIAQKNNVHNVVRLETTLSIQARLNSIVRSGPGPAVSATTVSKSSASDNGNASTPFRQPSTRPNGSPSTTGSKSIPVSKAASLGIAGIIDSSLRLALEPVDTELEDEAAVRAAPVRPPLASLVKQSPAPSRRRSIISPASISDRKPSLSPGPIPTSSKAFRELIDEGEVLKIPVVDIEANPEQPRQEFDPVEMRELYDSVGSEGQKMPALITPKPGCPGKYILVDGERRWRNCKALGIKTLKSIVVYGDPGELYLLSVIANCARAGHSDLELAFSIAKAKQIRPNDSNAKIARYYGKSESWVDSHLSLLRFPPEILRLMQPPYPKKKRLRYSIALFLTPLPVEDQIALAHEFHAKGIKSARAKHMVEVRLNELRATGDIRRAEPRDQYRKLRTLLANFEEKSDLLLQMSNPSLVEVFNTRELSHCDEIDKLLLSCGNNLKTLQRLMKQIRTNKTAVVESSQVA